MLKNFFNGKDKPLKTIFAKKALVKNVYSKYYIRKALNKNLKQINILDKDSSFINCKVEKSSISNAEGVSKNFNLMNYQHKKDKDLKISYLIEPKSKVKVDNVKRFYSLFYRLNQKKHLNGSFLLHKTVRGGYQGTSFGVRGFLPKRQGKLFIKKNITSLIQLNKGNGFIKKPSLLNKSSSLSQNLLVTRLKGQLNLGRGLAFLKKSKNNIQNQKFFNFIFTNPNFKKYFYAHKKRIKNKNFKSKNQKVGNFSTKINTKSKKAGGKKNF